MYSFIILVIFSLFTHNSSWSVFSRGRGKHGNLGEPPTDIEIFPEEQYFDQKLDHFNPSNTLTWKQRYFENGTFYNSGGPIFLMIGGEAEASPKWVVEGAWIDYARKYNALCLLVEHRFYGKSHPTDDLSVKNLSYLSSEQALADLSWFITSFNEKYSFEVTPKWIVFGGSYPGSLAVWMRLKYPHLVHGAVSSSGPLLALPDFKDYFRVVRDSLASYDPGCVSAIETGTKQLSSLLIHPLGQKSVHKLFNLCDPLDLNNDNDISNLHENLASNFAGIVQYNKDNRHSDSRIINITIDKACDIMLNKSFGAEVNRLAEINSLVLNASGEPCLNYKYDKMIKELRETNWDSKVAGGSRQWTYQTCTEFGFFQTSDLNSTKKMFGDKFPVEFFVKQCTDVYGSKFDMKFVKEATRMTNTVYGGLNNQAVNVVYVHGSVDPWHALGITRTLKPEAPAIFIEGVTEETIEDRRITGHKCITLATNHDAGFPFSTLGRFCKKQKKLTSSTPRTAHCANMYPPSSKDPPQLSLARKKIEKLIGEWLAQ